MLLCACERVDFVGFIAPTSDNVDRRFEQSMDINSNSDVKVIAADSRYTFYACTDTHIDGTTHNLSQFVDLLRNDANASFGVILGDCIDKKDMFPTFVKALMFSPETQMFNYDIMTVLGNHDTYFSGWNTYKELIGASVYRFEIACDNNKDLFIVLDSASGTLGYKQMQWLKNILANDRWGYRHCVILTHTNLFYTENTQTTSGCMPIEETLKLIDLFQSGRVTLVLQGHDHYREDLMLQGVRYTVIGAIHDKMQHPEFLRITMSDNGVEYDWQLIQ